MAEALAPAWSLEDAGLRVQKIEALGHWDIATTRVFLDPSMASAPSWGLPPAQGVLTYMVNEIRGPGPEAALLLDGDPRRRDWDSRKTR